MEYMEARQRYIEAKAEQRRLYEEVIRIKERNKPMLDYKKYVLFSSCAFLVSSYVATLLTCEICLFSSDLSHLCVPPRWLADLVLV